MALQSRSRHLRILRRQVASYGLPAPWRQPSLREPGLDVVEQFPGRHHQWEWVHAANQHAAQQTRHLNQRGGARFSGFDKVDIPQRLRSVLPLVSILFSATRVRYVAFSTMSRAPVPRGPDLLSHASPS